MDGLTAGDDERFVLRKKISVEQAHHAGQKGVGDDNLAGDRGVLGLISDDQRERSDYD